MKSDLNRKSPLKYEKENIELRRDRVSMLDAQCYSQHDIATKLNVSVGLVNSDLQYIRTHAKENIRKLIDERLPQEYNRTLAGLDSILKEVWVISSNTSDNTEKTQALSLAKQCYKDRMELLTNPTVVEDIIRIANKKQQVNSAVKHFTHMSEQEQEEDCSVTEQEQEEEIADN
jgi:hypothetical protein